RGDAALDHLGRDEVEGAELVVGAPPAPVADLGGQVVELLREGHARHSDASSDTATLRAVLEGRTGVVTGQDQPLGAGLARALAADGATVTNDVGPGVDALVHAAVEPLALEACRLADVDDDRWWAVW